MEMKVQKKEGKALLDEFEWKQKYSQWRRRWLWQNNYRVNSERVAAAAAATSWK